jgi:hypothetical protein
MCVLRNPKSLHMHKINHPPPRKHLHQLKMRTRLKLMNKKIKEMSHLKMTTTIKGEMQMIKTRRMKNQGRHTQESTKQSNEITPSTPSLATFIRGNHSISCCTFLWALLFCFLYWATQDRGSTPRFRLGGGDARGAQQFHKERGMSFSSTS